MPKRLPAALRLPSSALIWAGGDGESSFLLSLFVTPCLRGEIALDPAKSAWLTYLPLNCGGRFSRNAVVPSFLSSEEHATANNTASRYNPSANVISMPLLTASIAY